MFPEVWAHFGPIADPVQHRFSVFRVSRIFAAAVGSPPSMKLAPLLEIFEPISSMAFPSAGLGIHRLHSDVVSAKRRTGVMNVWCASFYYKRAMVSAFATPGSILHAIAALRSRLVAIWLHDSKV